MVLREFDVWWFENLMFDGLRISCLVLREFDVWWFENLIFDGLKIWSLWV